jgi:hypothetical protein
METPTYNQSVTQLDQATSRRLARLGAMPVDTASLDRRLAGLLPPEAVGGHRPAEQPDAAGLIGWISRRRWLAVAASILVPLLILTGTMALWHRGVRATPAEVALLHSSGVAGTVPTMPVSNVQEANALLAKYSPGSPQIPMVDCPIQSCCCQHLSGQKVACIYMQVDGTTATLAVAAENDVRMTGDLTVTRGGVTYRLQACGGVNMVSGQRNGRWFCLMGSQPTQRLVEVASAMQF